MATEYKLKIGALFDDKNLKAQIEAQNGKYTLLVNTKLDKKGVDEFNKIIEGLNSRAKEGVKLTFSKDEFGNATKAVAQFTDKMNNAVTTTINLGEKLTVTERIAQNFAKDAKELERASATAQKFLDKTESMTKTSAVLRGRGLAEDIKSAVAVGDIDKVRQLKQELANVNVEVSKGGNALTKWAAGLGRAIKQTVQYATSIGLVYGALKQLKDGIAFVSQLNKEMTNIQLLQAEGAQTNEQIADLALQYNDLAKAMGATTIEVAQGSTEWLRQGKSIEDTKELLQSTLMASKLGNMQSAEATEYLTAILNGFNLKAGDAVTVVDKLIAVDNKSATSFKELATAMQYSSAIAKESGVSFDNLTGYIATVSSRTRLSAEMIGTAFRTMFVRMQQVNNLPKHIVIYGLI